MNFKRGDFIEEVNSREPHLQYFVLKAAPHENVYLLSNRYFEKWDSVLWVDTNCKLLTSIFREDYE